jgi:DNA-binding MarR family transcriptional regulator
MKIVTRKSLKLDLPLVLGFVAAYPGVPSSILIPEMQRSFRCKKRAAQDALSILIAGGWLKRCNDERDARRKRYFLTVKGEEGLQTADGWREMRLSRWRHSTTSTRARRRRSANRRVF